MSLQFWLICFVEESDFSHEESCFTRDKNKSCRSFASGFHVQNNWLLQMFEFTFVNIEG